MFGAFGIKRDDLYSMAANINYKLIVLGNQRKNISKNRVDCAIDLVNKGNINQIIFSGGTTGSITKKDGTGHSINISEAGFMAEYFTKHYSLKYPKVVLTVEEDSTNTNNNIVNSAKLLSKDDNVIIVSSHPKNRLRNAAKYISKILTGTGEISFYHCGDKGNKFTTYRKIRK